MSCIASSKSFSALATTLPATSIASCVEGSTAKPMLLKIAEPEDKEAIEKVFEAKDAAVKEELAEAILKWDARTLAGGG